MLVPYAELHATMRDILVREGMERARADHCAQLFADASRDGVPSHGLNRFGRFVAMIRSGMVDIHAQPARIASLGSLERWDGRRGPGNLNAHASMKEVDYLMHSADRSKTRFRFPSPIDRAITPQS